MIYDRSNSPETNLNILSTIEYPGRLLIVGQAAGGLAVHVYVVGGRSDGSKNRILVNEDNVVGTAAFDKKKPVGNPKLTIYDAMRRTGTTHYVSNGDQTSTALQFARCGGTFRQAMNRRQFEPDKPNLTPRITGFTELNPAEGEPGFGISVLRRNPMTGGPLRRHYVEGDDGMVLEPGIGYCVHTYEGNGNPLPSFREAPFPLPLADNAEDTAEMIWERLHPNTRVAIAAKTIAPDGQVDISIINMHQRVAA